MNALAEDPAVAYVSPDRKVGRTLQYTNPTVGADIAYIYGYDGRGVGVAVIDSGIDPNHPDFLDSSGRSRVVYSESFVPSDATTTDAYGHGTHVAGIVAGAASKSTGDQYRFTFRGIAPSANVINLRALDSNGQGTDSSVIAAIDRAIALKTAYNIRVLNLSLGRQIMES